jgi:hypothetical protein
VLDHLIGGGGVHYSRKKSRYGTDRYRRKSDPLYSYTLIVGAMNHLRNAGLIEHTLGDRLTWWQSHARASEPLVELLSPVIDPLEPRGSWHIETIVLRDADGNDQDYVDTPETEAMRDELGVINKYLARLDLRHHGQLVHVPIVRRVFNETFSRGGRLYCAGESYQNHPGYQRRELTSITDGEAHPVVEIDYASLHPRMAYAKAGKRLPTGDPYTIEGFTRGLVKTSFNTVFNAATRQSAVNAIAFYNRGLSKTEAEDLVTAITRKHYRISESLYSDAGAQFQRTDSDMAVEILLRMIKYTGRCPLVMHDSFLVADIDADTLAETMEEVARDWGLNLELKDSRGPRTPHPPPTTTTTLSTHLSTMGVTTPDLRVSSRFTKATKTPWTPQLPVIPTRARPIFKETHPPPPEKEKYPLYGECTTSRTIDSNSIRGSTVGSDGGGFISFRECLESHFSGQRARAARTLASAITAESDESPLAGKLDGNTVPGE